MLARIVNMRGVDLRRFEFDYDLTWAGFFLQPDGRVLGRFGGRDAESPDKFLTLAGLKAAMSAALEAHRDRVDGDPPRDVAEDGIPSADLYPAAKRLKAGACIHCHQVYNFRQDLHRSRGTWTRDRTWVYPLPESLGFSLDPERQSRLIRVAPGSAAATAGLKAEDSLQAINGRRTASFADVQYALHLAPNTGKITVRWQRGAEKHEADLVLPPRWRESDISWRESMWGLDPSPGVYGKDLSAVEKERLGLPPDQLAFRQGDFVPPVAAAVGIRKGDIITGMDRKKLTMTMLQFNAYVRLNYKPGDRITLQVIREGKKMEMPMTLSKR